MRIIVSLDDKKLQRYLSRCREKCSYVYLGERNEGISHSLRQNAFEEISLDDYDDLTREKFLRDYIDLIGKLGRKHNSIYWWATYTASKNRFASSLSNHLSMFLSVVNLLRGDSQGVFLIINPPKEIVSSLKIYCRENSIDFELLHSPMGNIGAELKAICWQMLGIGHFVYQTWRNTHLAKRYLGKRVTERIQGMDECYVLRSILYSSSIDENGSYRDAFFGPLPDHLAKRQQDFVIVGGIIGDYRSIVKRIAKNSDWVIIPQELFLKYMDPIRVVFGVYRNRIRLNDRIYLEGLDTTDILKQNIGQDFRSVGTLRNYIYYFWMKKLIETVKVDTFTTTCENNPWERMCTLALKRYSPETMILGYQHTVVPQASANMFVSEYEKDVMPMPDKILTVGRTSKGIIERYGAYEPGKIEESCALRFEYLFDIETRPRGRSNQILVALEGVFDVYHLVNYVLRELKEATNYRVKIRSHPALPLQNIRHMLDYDLAAFPHVYLSENTSLQEDIDESGIVIYWGSTVALEALLMGKPIIHFDSGDILSYDPLFESSHLKWIVNVNENLPNMIENIYGLTDEEFELQLSRAKDYLDDYFYGVTEERLDKFMPTLRIEPAYGK